METYKLKITTPDGEEIEYTSEGILVVLVNHEDGDITVLGNMEKEMVGRFLLLSEELDIKKESPGVVH